MFLNFLFKNKNNNLNTDKKPTPNKPAIVSTDEKLRNERMAARKGEIGEYKIDIQLSQLPKECMYLSDLLISNPKSTSGYSQIDHVIITPYGLFVIETKNYQGTIYGGKDRKTWLINGKFKMMNPLMQNYGHIQALKRLIDVKFHDYIISMVSFTKRCTFKIEVELRKIHSNELVIYDVELTEFINRKIAILKYQNQNPFLMKEDIENIYNSLLSSNISDPSIRKQHVDTIQREKNNEVKIEVESKCIVCQKPVSEKVKSFCLSNKKFQGKIYCYEHQKTL
jgi:hypothetical protein